MERGRIVFADERVLVVDKPSGVSLATPRARPSAAVSRLLATLDEESRDGLGLEAETLLLVHRLDVGTSGLVVLARDQDAHRDLVEAFSKRHVTKTYLALVWGHPRPQEGEWTWPLGPDRSDRRRMRVDPGGRPARSGYRTLARVPHLALLALEPHTGRTHQLRVHLAYGGHPIVGDDLYGGPRERAVRDRVLRDVLAPDHTFLHAWRLHLPPTRSSPELFLAAPPPPDFAAALTALGARLPD